MRDDLSSLKFVSDVMPRYPVYVPTKGRHEHARTIRCLLEDGVPFFAVVEREEADAYARVAGSEHLLVLPESARGLIFARNWIKQHSIAQGCERHWQLDDNINCFRRWYKDKRLPCSSGAALAVAEDLTDRFEDVAVSGLNYSFFSRHGSLPPVQPFWTNVHVYSCSLINNAIPHRWRLRYNDDTDLCLQVLADGWYTILVNAFMVEKAQTMTVPGGNTADLYQGDGRLVMARSLERVWPGVVTVDRRWKRPQHVVNWKKFKKPLRPKPGADLVVRDYGLVLRAVREVKSAKLRALLEEAPA